MADSEVENFVTRFAAARAGRDGVVIIEWQSTRVIAGERVDWRGVDKFRLRDGKISEERVYMDTAPLRARRDGVALEPLLRL